MNFQSDRVVTKRCDKKTGHFGPSNFENCTTKVHQEITAIQNKVFIKKLAMFNISRSASTLILLAHFCNYISIGRTSAVVMTNSNINRFGRQNRKNNPSYSTYANRK